MSQASRLFPVPILTARRGTNADLFRDALEMYACPGDRIADVTYGAGRFWQKVDASRYDLLASDLADGGPDCRALPYDAKSLDGIVIDPPYIPSHDGDLKESIDVVYRVNESGLRSAADVLGLYQAALREAARCLRAGGVAFVKCQDTCENHEQHWLHIQIYAAALSSDFVAEDLFVLVLDGAPTMRQPSQQHARKNHSYLWVFRLP